MPHKEQMNIVIVGHVDHGKSTVIGRLLADTGSLPKGKLEQVKKMCAKNARPFEYAFLLDALKDEQAQGITIDIARCFFKTDKRDYIILDAPGHVEFLKNMVTGAAHAEAAFLVIDAKEGIQENSKRHAFMLSMLGIRQVTVLVNKMDLAGYREDIFGSIKKEYLEFLTKINVVPVSFIPISAREGENISRPSGKMSWYHGKTVLMQVDAFYKHPSLEDLPFRLPVQDVYKFTREGDDRRIVAGTIESGSIKVLEEVTFFPSGKQTRIKSIEVFNAPAKKIALAGEATGLTMTSQIYVKPGEIMVRTADLPPKVSNKFRANLFWVGRAPLLKNKSYKIKLAAARASVKLLKIINVLDATDLSTVANKQQIDRLDVAECIFETNKPIAFDLVSDLEKTSRFVIIDNYEIVGGGIILQERVKERELARESGKLKKYLPICVNLKNERILIIGGGKVALQKLKTLVKFSGDISVLARDFNSDISQFKVKKIKAAFSPACLDGYALVFACTDDKKLNARIKKAAGKRNMLANVADDPGLCDFIMPAIYVEKEMTVAVNSDGKNVKKSIKWRDRIRELFSE